MQRELSYIQCFGENTRAIPGVAVINFNFDDAVAPGQAELVTTLVVFGDTDDNDRDAHIAPQQRDALSAGHWRVVAAFIKAHPTITHLQFSVRNENLSGPHVFETITHLTLNYHVKSWAMFPNLDTAIMLYDLSSAVDVPRSLRAIYGRGYRSDDYIALLEALPAGMETIDLACMTKYRPECEPFFFPAKFPNLQHAHIPLMWDAGSPLADLTTQYGPLAVERATGIVPVGCFSKADCSKKMLPHCTSWSLCFNNSSRGFRKDLDGLSDWLGRQTDITELEVNGLSDLGLAILCPAISACPSALTRVVIPFEAHKYHFDAVEPSDITVWTSMLEAHPTLTCIEFPPRRMPAAAVRRAIASLPFLTTLVLGEYMDTALLLEIVQTYPGIHRLECPYTLTKDLEPLQAAKLLCDQRQRDLPGSMGIGLK